MYHTSDWERQSSKNPEKHYQMDPPPPPKKQDFVALNFMGGSTIMLLFKSPKVTQVMLLSWIVDSHNKPGAR